MNRLFRYASAIVSGIFVPEPAVAAEVNVEGSWEFTVQSDTGVTTPRLVLKQEGSNLTGSYKGSVGSASLKGAVKGREISLKMVVQGEGYVVPLAYQGVAEDNDTMRGSFALGRNGIRGKGTFTARKIK